MRLEVQRQRPGDPERPAGAAREDHERQRRGPLERLRRRLPRVLLDEHVGRAVAVEVAGRQGEARQVVVLAAIAIEPAPPRRPARSSKGGVRLAPSERWPCGCPSQCWASRRGRERRCSRCRRCRRRRSRPPAGTGAAASRESRGPGRTPRAPATLPDPGPGTRGGRPGIRPRGQAGRPHRGRPPRCSRSRSACAPRDPSRPRACGPWTDRGQTATRSSCGRIADAARRSVRPGAASRPPPRPHHRGVATNVNWSVGISTCHHQSGRPSLPESAST